MSFTYPPESKPLDGYTIKRAISVGGFGEVYYGLSDAGKEVALKLLRHNFDVELRGVSQCLNLNHPHLLQIFDIRTDRQGQHWIVMEYLSGRTLDELLEENPSGLPMEETRRWLSGMAAGLTYLHAQGLVHRDLKPANIFREGDTIKVGDVGLSKFITESQRNAQTQSVGTVYYMAPEVAHGKYGKEVDVYALGVILYEMLTGDVPFTGESQAEILMKHLTEKPNLENLPAKLRPVLARALEKDPHLRTPSVARLQTEFQMALDGHSLPEPMDIPAENILPERRPARPHELAQTYAATVYPDLPPAAATQPPRRREHAARHQQRAEYAAYPEQPAGLGVWKWVFAAAVLMWMVGAMGRGGPPFILMLIFVGGGLFVFRAILGAVTGSSQCGNRPQRTMDPGVPLTYAANVPPAFPPSTRARRQQRTKQQQRELRAQIQQRRREHAIEQRLQRARYVAARRGDRRRQRQPYGVVGIDPRLARQISLKDRLTDGSTSMTLAAVVGTIITLAVSFLTGLVTDFNSGVLFGSATILSAWAAIGVAKLGEGKTQPFLQRRLIWTAAGAGLGYVIWCLSSVLLVTLAGPEAGGRTPSMLGEIFDWRFLRDPGMVHPLSFVLFFGLLFGLRRWWWHADALRSKRIRVTSMIFTVGTGALAAVASGFPILWALSLSAAISGVVQLASAWMPLDARQHLLEGPRHVV